MSIIIYYVQEYDDPFLPPTTYFTVNKEQRHSFSVCYFSQTALISDTIITDYVFCIEQND